MPPDLFFFLKIALAIWGFSWFHTNFRIVFSIYLKIFDRNCIESIEGFG